MVNFVTLRADPQQLTGNQADASRVKERHQFLRPCGSGTLRTYRASNNPRPFLCLPPPGPCNNHCACFSASTEPVLLCRYILFSFSAEHFAQLISWDIKMCVA